MSRWALTFFGLTPENKIDFVWEQIYLLIRHCGFSHHDAERLPVAKRHWYVHRLLKEWEEQNRANNNSSADSSNVMGNNLDPQSRMKRF